MFIFARNKNLIMALVSLYEYAKLTGQSLPTLLYRIRVKRIKTVTKKIIKKQQLIDTDVYPVK